MVRNLQISKTGRVVMWAVFCIFALYAFTLLYPYVWMILNSFKNNGEYLDDSFKLPTVWRVGNYLKAFTQLKVRGTNANLVTMFTHSVVLATLGAMAGIFNSALAAYVLSKYRFWGRNAIYNIFIFAMTLPIMGALGAQSKLLSALNLKNNVVGLTVLYAAPYGFNFLLLFGAFNSLSWEYAEAAMMDGCSRFRIFLQIMLPLISPVLRSLFVIQFINIWNDFGTGMLYLPKAPTLSYGLYVFSETMQYKGANYPVYFAACGLAMIPIIILFVSFQNILMENMTAGGLKG